MQRNFDRIVEDTRIWLKRSSKPKFSLNNEVGNFGFVRRCYTYLKDPFEQIVAIEHTTLSRKRIGALVLQSEDVRVPNLTFRWIGHDYSVLSDLTFNRGTLTPIDQLSGVALDAIHDRLTHVVSAINLETILRDF